MSKPDVSKLKFSLLTTDHSRSVVEMHKSEASLVLELLTNQAGMSRLFSCPQFRRVGFTRCNRSLHLAFCSKTLVQYISRKKKLINK